jgi:hypothetical protein
VVTVLAVSGDTWGVSGPAFLVIYVCLLVAAGVLCLAGRRWTLRRRASGVPELHPVELAYLTGGAENALLVAFLGLYERSVIRLPDGRAKAAPGAGVADLPGDGEPTLLTYGKLVELTQDRRPEVVGPVSGHPVERALATALADPTPGTRSPGHPRTARDARSRRGGR